MPDPVEVDLDGKDSGMLLTIWMSHLKQSCGHEALVALQKKPDLNLFELSVIARHAPRLTSAWALVQIFIFQVPKIKLNLQEIKEKRAETFWKFRDLFRALMRYSVDELMEFLECYRGSRRWVLFTLIMKERERESEEDPIVLSEERIKRIVSLYPDLQLMIDHYFWWVSTEVAAVLKKK